MKIILLIVILTFSGSLYANSASCQSREIKLKEAITKHKRKASILSRYIQLAKCQAKHNDYQKVIDTYNAALYNYVGKEKRLQKRFDKAMSKYMAVAYFNLGDYDKSYDWSKIHFDAGRYDVDVMKLLTSNHFKQYEAKIRPALHKAILSYIEEKKSKELRELLQSGVDVNFQDKNGKTPLMKAAYFVEPMMVHLLLESGAKSNVTNKDGESALSFATYKAHPVDQAMKQVVKELYEHGGRLTGKTKSDFNKSKYLQSCDKNHDGINETPDEIFCVEKIRLAEMEAMRKEIAKADKKLAELKKKSAELKKKSAELKKKDAKLIAELERQRQWLIMRIKQMIFIFEAKDEGGCGSTKDGKKKYFMCTLHYYKKIYKTAKADLEKRALDGLIKEAEEELNR